MTLTAPGGTSLTGALLVVATLGLTVSAYGAPPKKGDRPSEGSLGDGEYSEKVGVSLEYQFDSSGPDAWDPAAHPMVFITTEGPGYGGLLSGVTLPGLAIIDADTREVVAKRHL